MADGQRFIETTRTLGFGNYTIRIAIGTAEVRQVFGKLVPKMRRLNMVYK